MSRHNLKLFLFRAWIKAHNRPLLLSQLRPMWHEAGRFARELA